MKGIDLKGKKIPIELDRTRYLIYDLNALAELEDRVGDLDSFFKSLNERVASGKGLSFKSLRLLLWAGLLSDDPDLTESTVGSFVYPGNLEEVTNKIIEAVNVSMPEVEEKKIAESEQTG